MIVEMKIPVNKWENFKNLILKKWFIDNEPILTRHKNLKSSEYEFAGFKSDYQSDVDYVISAIPFGGEIIK